MGVLSLVDQAGSCVGTQTKSMPGMIQRAAAWCLEVMNVLLSIIWPAICCIASSMRCLQSCVADHRADWKKCGLDSNQELEQTKEFREGFQPFDPMQK